MGMHRDKMIDLGDAHSAEYVLISLAKFLSEAQCEEFIEHFIGEILEGLDEGEEDEDV